MRIYIDESGAFIPDLRPRICCIAALAVPERFADELLGRYQRLTASWTIDREVKGSALSDQQTIEALNLLNGGYGTIAEICAIDILGRVS